MSLDARELRNILSLYNSPQSPLWAFPRTPEVRIAYLFDLDGWILFQSEDPEKKEMDFTTDLARADYSNGTLGKPGLPTAFRPGSQFQPFWKMVNDVKGGKFDLLKLTERNNRRTEVKNYFLAYSPIMFQGKVYSGIAYIDRTRFTLAAGYKHLDIMLILTIITIIAVCLIIFLLSHIVTKPIYKLAEADNNIQKNIMINNQFYYVRLEGSTYNIIQGNLLNQSEDWHFYLDGIALSESSNNLIYNNN